MKKILYITTTIKDEGPGNLLGTLLGGLDRTRYTPYVLTIQGGGKWEKEFKKLGIPMINLGLKTPLDFLSLPFLLYHIGRIKPDLVHTQLITADFFGRLAASILRKKYVTTIHNMDDWKRSVKPVSIAAKHFDAWQLKKARGIVAVSAAVKKDTVLRQKINPDTITVIKNSINLARFNNKISQDKKGELRNDLEIPANAVVVGASARLSKQKAPEVWLAAAKMIIAKKPNVHFVWAGDGPLQQWIKGLIKENKLEKNVHLAGFRKDLPELLQIFDIYTLVSRWEGLPLSLIEAMAASRACIASNVSGNPEVVTDRINGLLVPADYLSKFVEALNILINDSQLRQKLGRQAQKDVYQNFNLGRMLNEYHEFYQQLFTSMQQKIKPNIKK